MTPAEQAEHISDRTWHKQEMEKRRRMAQPAWKDVMEAQEALLASHQQRVMATQRIIQHPPTLPAMHSLTSIPDSVFSIRIGSWAF